MIKIWLITLGETLLIVVSGGALTTWAFYAVQSHWGDHAVIAAAFPWLYVFGAAYWLAVGLFVSRVCWVRLLFDAYVRWFDLSPSRLAAIMHEPITAFCYDQHQHIHFAEDSFKVHQALLADLRQHFGPLPSTHE